ncbi:MAG: hypothetical protein WBA39_30640 [Rivularia sp. (in: cyanobacteria)]
MCVYRVEEHSIEVQQKIAIQTWNKATRITIYLKQMKQQAASIKIPVQLEKPFRS